MSKAIRSLVIVLVLSGFGCNQKYSFEVRRPASTLEQAGSNPSLPAGPGLAPTLKLIQPAVAVRGIACLMCHANIKANIISDFGYGNSDFFNNSVAGEQAFTGQGWNNNYVGSWQTVNQVLGTVFVPKVTVPTNVLSAVGLPANTTSLASFLQTSYPVAQNVWDAGPTTAAMTANVVPAAGQPKVKEVSAISIQAPSESDLLALAPSLTSVGYLQINPPGATVAGVSGLMIQSGVGGQFVTNDPATPLNCSGSDVVVRGPLYLKNANIVADAGGCRFYVAGSVFIEGPINYVGTSTTQNLQIASSRIVSMGIDKRQLSNRFNDARGVEVRAGYANLTSKILADAAVVGTLADAANLSGNLCKTGQSFSGGTRAACDYTGLLLNAPILYSRYLGSVKGAMISEIALFSLGDFHFAYDPVFNEVNDLPLLTVPPLTVSP